MNISYELIIGICLLVSLIYFLFFCNSEGFANTPFLGFEKSLNFNIKSSFINFNRPDTIDWNLFMLNNKFKFQSIVPFFRFSESPLVYPPNNLPRAPQTTPVLMVPGLGDCLLKYENITVWPPKDSDSLKLLENNLVFGFDKSNSNLTPLINTLESLKYDKNTLAVEPYDFRNIFKETNLIELFKRIRQSIVKLYNYSNLPVILLGQDIGCTLLSLFLNRQQEDFIKKYIKNFVCVGSVFGGTIQGAKDYINGIPEFGKYKYLVRNFDGLKLKIPNKLFYDKTIVINYGGTSYNGKELIELLKYLNILPGDKFHELQKESLTSPKVKTIFINNKYTNEIHKELYEYWKPEVYTVNKENSKILNNYNTILKIIKLL